MYVWWNCTTRSHRGEGEERGRGRWGRGKEEGGGGGLVMEVGCYS